MIRSTLLARNLSALSRLLPLTLVNHKYSPSTIPIFPSVACVTWNRNVRLDLSPFSVIYPPLTFFPFFNCSFCEKCEVNMPNYHKPESKVIQELKDVAHRLRIHSITSTQASKSGWVFPTILFLISNSSLIARWLFFLWSFYLLLVRFTCRHICWKKLFV